MQYLLGDRVLYISFMNLLTKLYAWVYWFPHKLRPCHEHRQTKHTLKTHPPHVSTHQYYKMTHIFELYFRRGKMSKCSVGHYAVMAVFLWS